MSLSIDQSFQVTSIVSLAMWVKVLYSNLVLGGAKMRSGKRAPEDTYQMSQDKVKPEALMDTDRAQRIVNNDAENIPYGLIAAWASLMCIARVKGDTTAMCTAHGVMVVVFAAMRIGHTIAYRYALSYARSLFWMVGVFSVIGMGINGVIATFKD